VHHPTYYRTRTVDGLSIFALDTKADEIAALLREFMQTRSKTASWRRGTPRNDRRPGTRSSSLTQSLL
jgi:hypothetical protein